MHESKNSRTPIGLVLKNCVICTLVSLFIIDEYSPDVLYTHTHTHNHCQDSRWQAVPLNQQIKMYSM